MNEKERETLDRISLVLEDVVSQLKQIREVMACTREGKTTLPKRRRDRFSLAHDPGVKTGERDSSCAA